MTKSTMTKSTMTKSIKDKLLTELTIEDKALICTARDIYWIKEDLLVENYMFISSILDGECTPYNAETNSNDIELEFNELISGCVPDVEETATVSTMLESVYDYADTIIDILDKISTVEDGPVTNEVNNQTV